MTGTRKMKKAGAVADDNVRTSWHPQYPAQPGLRMKQCDCSINTPCPQGRDGPKCRIWIKEPK